MQSLFNLGLSRRSTARLSQAVPVCQHTARSPRMAMVFTLTASLRQWTRLLQDPSAWFLQTSVKAASALVQN